MKIIIKNLAEYYCWSATINIATLFLNLFTLKFFLRPFQPMLFGNYSNRF